MKQFAQELRLFCKTKQCSVTLILSYIVGIGIILYKGIRHYITYRLYSDLIGTLLNILQYQLWGFLIFLFTAYEYMSQSRKCFAEERLCCMRISKLKQEGMQFLLCAFFDFLQYCIFCGIGVVFGILFRVKEAVYYPYVLYVFLIYNFAVNIVAILLGWCISHIKKTMLAYVLLLLTAFYWVIRAKQYLPWEQEVLGGLSDLTQIFGVGAWSRPNYGYLFPVELHFAVKPLFAVAFLAVILFGILFAEWKKKRLLVCQSLAVLVMIGAVLLWNYPVSGAYYGYQDDSDALYKPLYMDNANEPDTYIMPDPGFSVKQYEMELHIGNQMSAEVKVKVSDATCVQYAFTLFCGYDIIDITDAEGNSIQYEREGNWITVHRGDKELDWILFKYQGRGTNRYYAGRQGIFLPGNFPYYPMAGKHNIYSQGLCQLPDEEMEFLVKLIYDKEVYANIKEIKSNILSGTSNHLTLAAGFWKEQVIEGIDYIYPCIGTDYNPEINQYITDAVKEYWDKEIEGAVQDYSIHGKKILISPFAFEAGNYMFGSDLVILCGRYDLENFYTHYVKTGHWYYYGGMTSEEVDQLIEETADEEIKETIEEYKQAGE